MTKYLTPAKFAQLHGKSKARVHQFLAQGRIKGAQRLDGNGWIIPAKAPWPAKEPGRPAK
jgi:hypothetical protein